MNDYYVLLLLKHALFTKPMENHRKPHIFASLGLSWVALGRSWAALGRSWAALGHSWALLGALGTTLKNHQKNDQKNDRCWLPKWSPKRAKIGPKTDQNR